MQTDELPAESPAESLASGSTPGSIPGSTPGPRIFCIPATDAPIVAVIRRGPSDWCHVGLWNTRSGDFEAGSWIRGTIYPQRCDLSPDGRWLVYFVLKGSVSPDWVPGTTYIAVSRLPWLHALAAWGTSGTWTRGLHFIPKQRRLEIADPDEGNLKQLRKSAGLEATYPGTFAVERRHGWVEAEGVPARGADDPWDEKRADSVVMEKARPGHPSMRLTVAGTFAAFRSGEPSPDGIRYRLFTHATHLELDDVQWADWDRAGRLLVATRAGELQIRESPFTEAGVVSRVGLAALSPKPEEPPEAAYRW